MAFIGTWRGGVPRIYYEWMKPGSLYRRSFEKSNNPYVDLDNGTSIYYRDLKASPEAAFVEADAYGPKGKDRGIDLYNEYKVVPDMFSEGFTWKHRLNTEYNQWHSNTWWTPDLIPAQHRGRFLCNFHMNLVEVNMRMVKFRPFDTRSFSYVCLYVGTGKGIAGFGQGLGPSMQEAKKEAIRNAFDNIAAVDLEDDGPAYPVNINFENKKVLLYPSNRLICHTKYADIMCAFGFMKGGLKYGRKSKTRANNQSAITRAIFECIRQYRAVSEVAHSRGKVSGALLYNYYPYLEEIRRRKGMMAQHPKNKDTLLHPNRIVDNRLPDHLKKGYYDDIYWKDFFAGKEGRLNDPRLGLRGDEQRAALHMNPQHRSAAGRRTLGDVLAKMGKNVTDITQLEIRNPHLDKSLAEHWRMNYNTT